MKRSNRLVILVGVLLAVLAFVAIVILLNQRTDGNGQAEEPVTQAVLVATEDIDIGEEVTPDKVEKRDIDPAAYPTSRQPRQFQGVSSPERSLAGPCGWFGQTIVEREGEAAWSTGT